MYSTHIVYTQGRLYLIENRCCFWFTIP